VKINEVSKDSVLIYHMAVDRIQLYDEGISDIQN